MNVSFEGNQITIDGKTSVLEAPIRNALVVRDGIIVLFDPEAYPEDDDHYERNIVAIDSGGRVLWRIERSKGRIECGGKSGWSAYGAMGIHEHSGRRWVYEPRGFEHELDPERGTLSGTVFMR